MTDSLAENFQGLSLSISHSEDREDITQAKDATVIEQVGLDQMVKLILTIVPFFCE